MKVSKILAPTGGFGIKHIQERHGGYVPAAGEMEIVLHNAPNCKNGLNGGDKTVECTYPVGAGI